MDQTILGVGHNDIYEDPEFVRAMREAMKLIAGRANVGSAKQTSATPD